MIELDGSSLTLESLGRIAIGGEPAALTAAARARVQASRDVVERHAASGTAVYGVNTGFGALADVAIPHDQLARLQLNLIRSHAAGVGEPLPVPVVRALMALRANVLAKGFSGIRLETLDALIAMLNAGVHPRVPSRGSVGASGDLAPLAHLALVLIGEGTAGDVPGAEALARAGLRPVALAPKEGLALINGTQYMTARGVLATEEAHLLLGAAQIAAAMSTEALFGSVNAFDARIHAIRPHPGQVAVAANLRALLAGSEIVQSHAGCDRVQDPYSERCTPQVLGASLDALAHVDGFRRWRVEAFGAEILAACARA